MAWSLIVTLLVGINMSFGEETSTPSMKLNDNKIKTKPFFDCKFSVPRNSLCFSGEINREVANQVKKIKYPIKNLYITSRGGDVNSSIEIGKRIFKDGSVVHVNGFCLSSCANYLIPAASHVKVNKNSFIAIHGSIPRNFSEFLSSIGKSSPQFESEQLHLFKQYKITRNNILKRETDFFDDIGVDDAYLTRFRELSRTNYFTENDGTALPVTKKYVLVVDKKYLEVFGIKSSFEDKEPRYCDLIYSVTALFGQRKVIYGFYGLSIDSIKRESKSCPNHVKPDDAIF